MNNQSTSESVYRVEQQTAGSVNASLPQLVATLLDHWRLLVALPAMTLLVVFSLLIARDRQYEAAIRFIPQADSNQRGGLMSGMAAQLGVDLGSGSADTSPAFYAELVESASILRPLVEQDLFVRDSQGALEERSLGVTFDVPEPQTAEGRRELIAALRSRLDVSVDRTTGIVRVAVTAPEPAVAVAIAERIFELLGEFNLQRRRSLASAEREFLQGRVQEARESLVSAENEQRSFLERNATWQASPMLSLEHARLQRSITLRQQVYTSLSQALEDAKIEEVRTTPVITLIETPTDTVKPVARRTAYWLVVAAISSGAIALAVVLAWAGLVRQFALYPAEAARLRRVFRSPRKVGN